MSIWRLVKLKFGNSPVHFGEIGIGLEQTSERLASDALFSAWVSAYARLFGKVAIEQLLQRFIGQTSPPVRMSSTFVYYQPNQGTEIYYLPRPLQLPINYPDEDLKFFKTYKKLNYLSSEVWQRWYQGDGFTKNDEGELIAKTTKANYRNNNLERSGLFSYGEAFKTAKHPKVAVDRVTAATNLYQTGFAQFKWPQNSQEIQSLSGLYFLIQFPKEDKALESNLSAALEFLGEEGLGGRRSSGAGRFEVEWYKSLPQVWEKIVNPDPSLNQYCLISLFWDNDLSILQQLRSEESSYEIKQRRGWIAGSPSGRNLRRKSVQMFMEGSVFPVCPSGKLADVTPSGFTDHKIYRSGIALSLPIQVKSVDRIASNDC